MTQVTGDCDDDYEGGGGNDDYDGDVDDYDGDIDDDNDDNRNNDKSITVILTKTRPQKLPVWSFNNPMCCGGTHCMFHTFMQPSSRLDDSRECFESTKARDTCTVQQKITSQVTSHTPRHASQVTHRVTRHKLHTTRHTATTST